MAKVYRATAVREGIWWIITVPELDAVTQARHLREISTMATGLIAALLDLDEVEVDVDVTIELPEAVKAAWAEAERLQAEVETSQRRSAELRREVVNTLLSEGHLSQAEAGKLLGLSHQRVQQLAKAG